MKDFTLILLILFLQTTISAQIEISSSVELLTVSKNENSIIYFKFEQDIPDEYPEGYIYEYNVLKNSSKKLFKDKYILDFVDIKFSNDNNLYFSSGNELQKIDFTTQSKETVFSVDESKWIKSFDISGNNKCLIVITEDSTNNKVLQEVVFLELDIGKKLSKTYCEEINKNIDYDLDAIVSNTMSVFLKKGNQELIHINPFDKNKKVAIDKNVLELLKISDNNLYYLKENSIWSYNLSNYEKIEIIQSSNLDVNFFDTYKSKIFVCLNDNVFIYDSKEQTFKEVSQLGKKEFVFFGKKIALFKDDNQNKLNLILNSNKN